MFTFAQQARSQSTKVFSRRAFSTTGTQKIVAPAIAKLRVPISPKLQIPGKRQLSTGYNAYAAKNPTNNTSMRTAAAAASSAQKEAHSKRSLAQQKPATKETAFRVHRDVDAWANDPSQKIVPKFWTPGKPGWDLKDISIDCSNRNLRQYLVVAENGAVSLDSAQPAVQELKAEMEAIFKAQGVVYVRQTGLSDPAELKAVMALAELESMVYEGGANMRPVVEGQADISVYETGAPKDAHIHYHHEMAYVKESCKWIGFMCLEGTDDPMKGASYISQQVKATEDLLHTEFGQKLKEKGVCYIRKLPDKKYFEDNNLDGSIVYNYWQTSMLTEDPAEAERVARKKGLEVEWENSPVFGRYMVTKFYVSTFEYCPYTDKNLLYASVADDYMWFDNWPGVVNLPHWERPLKLNFGDDSVMTRAEKQQFVDVYDRHGTPIPWEQGDLALCCNYRTAHGRPAYSLDEGEKRELGVVLGNLYRRQGHKEGKWHK